MRLIDAEELMHELDEQVYMQVDDFSIIANVVRSAPTIEAKPVVHAHWKSEDILSSLYCSNCGECALRNYFEDEVASKYCPNCGALMDEIVEGSMEIVKGSTKIVEGGKE